MKILEKLFYGGGASLLPVVVLAQDVLDNFTSTTNQFGSLVDLIIPILFTIAILVFIWNVVKYLFLSTGEEKLDAKRTMVYGLIALFVLASIWGIVALIQQAVGVKGDSNAPSLDRIVPSR